MKRIFLPVLFLFLGLHVSKAQHFLFLPDRIHEESVSAFEYSSHYIFMENLTGGELILGWEKISMDFPATWEADLCDYVGCYMGVPDNGTMSPISDTIQGFLKISLNPNDTPGTGTIVFKVFDNKHPEVVDTCTFIIHATEVTAVATQDAVSSLEVHPNPAVDVLTVTTDGNSEYIKIYDLQGRVLQEQRTDGQKRTKISVRNLKSGIYMVTTTNNGKVAERTKILIQ